MKNKIHAKLALWRRARTICAVVFDCDGVLTNGQTLIAGDGHELVGFSVQDGSGLTWMHRAGIRTAIVTGRSLSAVSYRANTVGVEVLLTGVKSKVEVFETLCQKLACPPEQIAYVGDDLLDLPLMRRFGLAVAVANACREVKAAAHYVTRAPGGDGAAREVAEVILRARHLWADVTAKYYL